MSCRKLGRWLSPVYSSGSFVSLWLQDQPLWIGAAIIEVEMFYCSFTMHLSWCVSIPNLIYLDYIHFLVCGVPCMPYKPRIYV